MPIPQKYLYICGKTLRLQSYFTLLVSQNVGTPKVYRKGHQRSYFFHKTLSQRAWKSACYSFLLLIQSVNMQKLQFNSSNISVSCKNCVIKDFLGICHSVGRENGSYKHYADHRHSFRELGVSGYYSVFLRSHFYYRTHIIIKLSPKQNLRFIDVHRKFIIRLQVCRNQRMPFLNRDTVNGIEPPTCFKDH